jgi:hypothetical protein
MRLFLLRAIVCLCAVLILTSSFAEDTAPPARQKDFSVKFEWDSEFGFNDIVGDKFAIDVLKSMVSNTGGHFQVKLYGYLKLNEHQYAVLEKISLLHKNLPNSNSELQELINQTGTYLNFIITSNGKHKIIGSKDIQNYVGPGLFGSIRDCMQNHVPIFRADLNHDGHPEVFYFTSEPNPPSKYDEADDWIDLHVIRGTDFKQVFETRLVRDDWTTPDTDAERAGPYQRYKNGRIGYADPNKPGERSFETLYFGDLRHQKQMNILVVRYNQGAFHGWDTKSMDYTLYTMNPDVTFTKTVLSKEAGEKLADQAKAEGATMLPDTKQNFCSPDWH